MSDSSTPNVTKARLLHEETLVQPKIILHVDVQLDTYLLTRTEDMAPLIPRLQLFEIDDQPW